ncbi:putative HC-toxin efflux carrier [Rhypophila sp. PSN 637]
MTKPAEPDSPSSGHSSGGPTMPGSDPDPTPQNTLPSKKQVQVTTDSSVSDHPATTATNKDPELANPAMPKIADPQDRYLSGLHLHLVIACLFFGGFLMALDTNIINVAVPKISSDFASLADIAWYGNAYLLTITAFQPIYGSAYKFFRTDYVYRVSVIVFELGSILCAAANGSNMFIVGRAVAGLGAAGLLQGALSIISQVVPLEKRPLYMGVVISVFVITVTVGPVLGGVFTEYSTWRWCFWINVPIGAVVLLGITFTLRATNVFRDDEDSSDENGTDTNKNPRRLPLKTKLLNMDPLGCVLFLGAICSLLLALQWGGQTKPWKHPDVAGCLAGSAVLSLLFGYWQWKRGDDALIPLRVLKYRSIWTGGLVLFFLGAAAYVNALFLPFYFQAVRGQTPVQTGVAFIPLLLPQLVGLIVVGAIVKIYGHYVPYMLVGELIAIAGQAMLIRLQPDSTTVYWAGSMAVAGLGTGMAMQLPYTAVAVVLSDEDIPTGNAIAVLFYQLGGAIAISVGQVITITTLFDLVAERQGEGLLPGTPFLAEMLLAVGAPNLHLLTGGSAAVLAVLREIWNSAIAKTMIVSLVVVAASVPFTLGMEWLNAVKVAEERRKKKEEHDTAGAGPAVCRTEALEARDEKAGALDVNIKSDCSDRV